MSLARMRLLALSFWGLLVLASILAVLLFWGQDQARPVGTKAKVIADKPAPQPAPAPALSRYEKLASSPCFAPTQASGVSKLVQDNQDRVELPSLEGFKLVGVMSGPKGLSLAVVEQAGSGRQEMVGPGDQVGPGRVAAVLKDRILVDLQGQRRQLVLEDQVAEMMAGVLTIRSEMPKPTQPQAASSQNQTQTVEKELRLQPLASQEKAAAVLSPGRVGASLGLKPDDLIQGYSPSEVQSLIDELAEGKQVRLSILRSGQSLNVCFNPL